MNGKVRGVMGRVSATQYPLIMRIGGCTRSDMGHGELQKSGQPNGSKSFNTNSATTARSGSVTRTSYEHTKPSIVHVFSLQSGKSRLSGPPSTFPGPSTTMIRNSPLPSPSLAPSSLSFPNWTSATSKASRASTASSCHSVCTRLVRRIMLCAHKITTA